jgi:hypothetical protein
VSQDLLVAAEQARRRARELHRRAEAAVAQAAGTIGHLQEFTPRDDSETSRLTRELEGLRVAMRSRALIEQAKGIVMGAMNCDEQTAFQVLVRQSQHENRKLRDVAAELVATKRLR